jgi:hypothetical protein
MASLLSNLLGLNSNAFAGARWSDISIRWVGLLSGALVGQMPARRFAHYA